MLVGRCAIWQANKEDVEVVGLGVCLREISLKMMKVRKTNLRYVL